MNAEEHLGLVRLAAGRATKNSDDYDDAMQDGTIGLLKACERFDESRGVLFSTFAYPRIWGAIIDGMRIRDRLTRSLRRDSSNIKDARATLTSKLGREPTSHELAASAGVAIGDLVTPGHQVSFDAPVGEDGHALQDVFAGSDGRTQADIAEQMLIVKARIHRLSPRELQVIGLYYFDGCTGAHVSRVMGVSEARISQLRQGALEKLRESRYVPGHRRRTLARAPGCHTHTACSSIRGANTAHMEGRTPRG